MWTQSLAHDQTVCGLLEEIHVGRPDIMHLVYYILLYPVFTVDHLKNKINVVSQSCRESEGTDRREEPAAEGE
jgi:hypothetical protein